MFQRQISSITRKIATQKAFNNAIYNFQRSLSLSSPNLGIVTFKLADIGEGIAEVELLKNYKNVGDEIEEMDAICEVQSDKAAVEISSRFSGKITKLYHNVGDIVRIGSPLVDIDSPDHDHAPSSSHDKHKEEHHEEKKVEKKERREDREEREERRDRRDERDERRGDERRGDEREEKRERREERREDREEPEYHNKDIKALPSTRRIAKERGIDLSQVKGTGKGGIITKEDLENFKARPSSKSSSSAPSSPKKHTEGTFEEVPIKGYGRAMVKSMESSLKIPHMSLGEEFNLSKLVELRESLKPLLEKDNKKVTITPFILKALSIALKKNPLINSKFNGNSYIVFKEHNMSIAIDTPNGLVVPNIKNVERLSIMEIQEELSRLQKDAMNNKLQASDLTNGTISISNVGVIGGTYVKAIIFDQQAAILALGRLHKLPRFDNNGQVTAASIMNINISADHRHLDGATVARFATDFRNLIENPASLLLNLQ